MIGGGVGQKRRVTLSEPKSTSIDRVRVTSLPEMVKPASDDNKNDAPGWRITDRIVASPGRLGTARADRLVEELIRRGDGRLWETLANASWEGVGETHSSEEVP